MANTETTFADRLGRAEQLSAACKGFTQAFKPSDQTLHPDAFAQFLVSVTNANNQVSSLKARYTNGSTARLTLMKNVKQRTQLVKSFIESDSKFKPYQSSIKNIVKKLLNYKPSKSVAVPKPTEEKKRNKGEQSYADILNLFKALIAALNNVQEYTPQNEELKIDSLTALSMEYEQKTNTLNDVGAQLSIAADERRKIYNGEAGLREKMKSIKYAVKSQYGTDSSEFNAVKGIRV